MEQLKQAKEQCLTDIRANLPNYVKRLNGIDPRLVEYIEDAISNDGSHANMYELLGIRKEFRLMDTYEMDTERVKRTMRAIEGQWKNGRHVKGGLKFDTPRGNQHVRLMAYQVWCLFGIYGFKVDVNMERRYVDGEELLPTEWVDDDGWVWDTRRLTEECHLFQTRKSGKTEFGGAIDFVEVCFLGPANGQALICAPSAEQSQIAYKAIKEFSMQVDPTCVNRMGGKLFRMTAKGMNWQPGHRMKGEIKCMAAGKVSKDGLYASVVHADEHGQPGYINGHCDMQSAVETCWGSTGPRREKLLMHTTTAGKTTEGPYKDKLTNYVEPSLLKELQYQLGQPNKTPDDSWFAFLLRLDPWEITDELDKLNDTELFKKVNRSIGITVQPDYYRKRLYEAKVGIEDTRKEVLTKDFNIWQTGTVKKWVVTADDIRRLQRPRHITECLYVRGWSVFVGLDFSGGEDLFAMSFLAVNYAPGLEMKDRFFADTYLWILEHALQKSPNRQLYEMWIKQGWLRVCPGKVFNPDYAINELMALNTQGINLVMFGYDPAQSHDPVNTIKAWLQTLGISASVIHDMLVPVGQGFVVMNPLVQKFERMVLSSDPWLQFSENPMWPWMVGNAVLIYSRDETLCRLQKSGEHRKIDGIAALMDAIAVFDVSEGKVQQ